MTFLEAFVEQVVIGLTNGALIATIAVGLSLLFGIMEMINVAYGEILTLGGYLMLVVAPAVGNPLLGLVSAALLTFLFGVFIDRIAFRQLFARLTPTERVTGFIVFTLGLSLFLQNVYMASFGYNWHFPPALVEGVVDTPILPLKKQKILLVGLSIVMLTGLFLFIKRTKAGRALRAIIQDADAAQALGVNIQRMRTLTVGVGAMMAGIGGALVTPILAVFPFLGLGWIWKGFACIVIAGMKNLVAVLFMGFVLGIVEGIAFLFMPFNLSPIVDFVFMIVVLVIRPRGIFGEKQVI